MHHGYHRVLHHPQNLLVLQPIGGRVPDLLKDLQRHRRHLCSRRLPCRRNLRCRVVLRRGVFFGGLRLW